MTTRAHPHSLHTICLLLLTWLPLAACQSAANEGNTDVRATARRAAAEHASVSPGEVTIVSVEAVEFADSSLGCPEPDMAYLMVITPGYKVIARVGERELDVRVAGQRGFACEQPPRVSPRR